SLFILGMTHGLGRGGQYAQQHRGFLELCEQQKWLDVFADPKVNERRADWIALVDSYLEKQQGDPEYYNWLRQLFISIRAVAVRRCAAFGDCSVRWLGVRTSKGSTRIAGRVLNSFTSSWPDTSPILPSVETSTSPCGLSAADRSCRKRCWVRLRRLYRKLKMT